MRTSGNNKPRTDYGPAPEEMFDWLGLRVGSQVSDLLSSALCGPVLDLLERPAKNLRGQLVRLGVELAGNDITSKTDPAWQMGVEVLELLHAGSLVIDDIEDGSSSRRGQPTLHERYGVPIALNVGNWLYFYPMEKLRTFGLSAEIELSIYRNYHRAMFRAHVGQALDIGTSIDHIPKERVHSVSLASLELKSGALTALALTLGATLGGASPERIALLEEFGVRFGIVLQMFDDLGNAKGIRDPKKRWEDLRLRRPSWVWAFAAESMHELEYRGFTLSVSALPNETPLVMWFEKNPRFLAAAKDKAIQFLSDAQASLERSFSPFPSSAGAILELRRLGEKLIGSYD